MLLREKTKTAYVVVGVPETECERIVALAKAAGISRAAMMRRLMLHALPRAERELQKRVPA